MLLIDRALETAYITFGLSGVEQPVLECSVKERLSAEDVGAGDFALISTAEFALLTKTHCADPVVGLWASSSGAIAMRTAVRPDEIEEAAILLYDVSGTSELLARATIWPFYGIKATSWNFEADGTSAIAIVDGMDALEPAEAGFSEDLVRAWYILTEQPVVTHLLAVPSTATEDDVIAARNTLEEARKIGHLARRDVRKLLLAESSAAGDQLVDYLGRLQHELDDSSRAAAYSLIARGAGGTRFPLIREIPWWAPTSVETEASPDNPGSIKAT